MLSHCGRVLIRFAAISLSAASAVLIPFAPSAFAQSNADSPPKICPGLYAGVTPQFLPVYFAETPRVQLSFLLLNDSEKPLDVRAGSWRIVINGIELKDLDTQQIFGNGPMPVGGWRVLKPGETYQFGKALSIEKDFPTNGQYKVSWRGAAFQSPTISLTIPTASH